MTKKKDNSIKIDQKGAYLVGSLEALIFSIFISCGNTYMYYQICGTKYTANMFGIFMIQFPIYLVTFECFMLIFVAYISLKSNKK